MSDPIVRPDVNPEADNATVLEMQQDYSPGYDIVLNSKGVLEGTRLKSTANASTDKVNIVEFDLASEPAANAMNLKYPKAWPMSYPTVAWSFWDANGQSNAAKLETAINLYLYLTHGQEVSNVVVNEDNGNLETTRTLITYDDRSPYSEYMDESNSPYRMPPKEWNREFVERADGVLVDSNGNPVEPVYLDDEGMPLSVNRAIDIGTKGELDLLTQMLQLAWRLKKVPATAQQFFNPDGTLVKPLTELSDPELVILRDSNVFTEGYTLKNTTYIPHSLDGTSIVGYKVIGTHAANLISPEHQAMTQYQTTISRPVSMYDWGGPYATGKNTF